MITIQEEGKVKTAAKRKGVAVQKQTTKVRGASKRPHALVWVEGEQCFWGADGQILRSLIDLKHALSAMSGETYTYHVTGDKNDFAVWVESVLSDKKCADGLRKAKTQRSAITCVEKCLESYAG